MNKYNTDNNILDEPIISYNFASKYLRFWNFVIDFFIIIVLFSLVIFTCLFLGIRIPYDYDISTIESQIRDYLMIATIMMIYYTSFEYFFNGKTIGKFFTNTRAVTSDNRIMNFDTVLKRSLCRIIPIEIASFFGNAPSGWHDQWSDTKVILDELKEEEEFS